MQKSKIEEIAGNRARDAAIRDEREYWLPRLELWHADSEGFERAFLDREIKRLRRLLGIRPEPVMSVRSPARARVARWRARS